MKISILKKVDMRKKIKGLKASCAAIGSNPYTDWQIVFFLSTIVALVIVGFGALTFFRVNNGTLYEIPKKKVAKVTTIDRKSLTNIIEFFEAKAARYSALKLQKNIYVDPSL